MARKKTERKSKNLSEVLGVKDIFNSEKSDFILGVLLVFVSVFVSIAMVSFLSTGQADQSILEDMRPAEWLNTDRQFQNYCSSFGAILSYLLIKVYFGLPSFLVPLFGLIAGFRLMRVYSLNLWKWFFYMCIIMIWTSVALAKFLSPLMSQEVFNPGGDHGLFCVQFLENLVGPPGLTCILILTAIVFMTFVSSQTIKLIRKMLNPVKYLTSKVKFTITNVPTEEEEEAPAAPADTAEAKESEEEQMPETTINLGSVITSDVEEIAKKPAPEKQKESQLSVAVAKEDETSNGSIAPTNYDINTPINPKEPFTNYKYPTLDLLKKYENDGKPVVDMEEIKANNEQIVKVLKSFGIDISVIKATVGPTITVASIYPRSRPRWVPPSRSTRSSPAPA